MYKDEFKESNMSYVDVAHALGCCELTARKKINGESKVTNAEKMLLDNLFKGENKECTISRHSR